MDWQDLMMVSDDQGLLSVSCEVKELYLSPGHVVLTVYMVLNIVHCAKSMVYRH